MSKVEKLHIVKKTKRVDKRSLDILNTVAKSVKNGEVHCVLVIGLKHDGSIMRGWRSPYVAGSAFGMIGAIEKTKADFMEAEIEK